MNLRRAIVLAAIAAGLFAPSSAAAVSGTFYTGPLLINTGGSPDSTLCVSNPTSSTQTISVVYRKNDGSLESGPVNSSVPPSAFNCPTHNVQANIVVGIELTASSTRMMPTLRLASPATTLAAGDWRVIAAGGDDNEVLSDLSASAANTSAGVAALDSDLAALDSRVNVLATSLDPGFASMQTSIEQLRATAATAKKLKELRKLVKKGLRAQK